MATTLDTLVAAGLEPVVAEIYLILIQNGELTVPKILENTSLSRASVYDALTLLVAQNYVEYRKQGRNAFYKPGHPNKLFELIEQKKRDVALLEGEVKETIQELTGTFNLALSKPGVRFFQGIEGIKEVLWDSLDAQGDVYTMGDLENFIKHSKSLNDEYVAEKKKRAEKKGVPLKQKKAITIDSPFNRSFLSSYDNRLTNTRLLKNWPNFSGATLIEIYDDRVSYTTFTDESLIGLIIQDKHIYNYQKSIFEYLWEQAVPIQAATPNTSASTSPAKVD